jgi:hypothetical protein
MAESKNKEQPDDPRRADEEGDPLVTGRSHGRIVDRNNPEGASRPAPDDGRPEGGKNADEKSEDWESGRQRAL